uniref:Lytic transglycosylase catalytic n=1 Tax=Nitratidesulfovibrio vulgaris (strain DSM 19637 / Miyazaki F) TaxID=883 RepID=B8DMU3_NITV9
MESGIPPGMPGVTQGAYPADARAVPVVVPPAAGAILHGPNGAISRADGFISGADAGDGPVDLVTAQPVPHPVAFLPPAGHPPSENLLDRMDVYALSPDAAKLALPRMVPLVMVERVRAGRLPMPAWDGIIARASRLSGLEERLIAAVVRAESGFNVGAVSPKGARGPMQIMPATGQELGLDDPFDPQANVEAGSRYLRQQLDRFGSLELALAAYNAGPGNVERFGGVPPFAETRAFVNRVLSGLD